MSPISPWFPFLVSSMASMASPMACSWHRMASPGRLRGHDLVLRAHPRALHFPHRRGGGDGPGWRTSFLTYHPEVYIYGIYHHISIYIIILTFYLIFYLIFYLASILTLFLAFYLASIQAFILAILFGIFSSIHSGIYSEILSGINFAI